MAGVRAGAGAKARGWEWSGAAGGLTPQAFIDKWAGAALTERSAAQQHFLDLCRLLGQPAPADLDGQGAFYTFEKGVSKTGGGTGRAPLLRWLRSR